MSLPNDPSYEHCYATLDDGVRLHYVDVGPRDGTTILLLHGWPDVWWGWREQIKHFRSNYRLLIPDQPGFGATTSPDDYSLYTRKRIIENYAKLLDSLDIDKVIVVGHDWGGLVAWYMALYQPHRVLAVASLCTPYWNVLPANSTLEDFVKLYPTLAYQLYLVQDNAAQVFDANVEKFFRLMYGFKCIRAPEHTKDPPSMWASLSEFEFDPATPRPRMSESDLQYLVAEYSRQGFQHGLNWYKTSALDNNDRVGLDIVLHHPALFITGGKDRAVSSAMTEGMEKLIPNLQRCHLDEASHWLLWESPDEVNAILERWFIQVTA